MRSNSSYNNLPDAITAALNSTTFQCRNAVRSHALHEQL